MLSLGRTIHCRHSYIKTSLSCSTDNSATVAAESPLLIKVLRNKLVQNKNEVEVQRNDPSSPLHSVKSFEELPL